MNFGKRTEVFESPDGKTQLHRETSFSHGKAIKVGDTFEESFAVTGVVDVLTVIGESLRNIDKSVDRKVAFEIVADPKTNLPTLVKKRYLAKVDRR